MKTICEKVNMTQIENALKQKNWCKAMQELEFDLRFYEGEYPDDYFFLAKDDSLLVFYRLDIGTFWTYPRANSKVISSQFNKKKKEGAK